MTNKYAAIILIGVFLFLGFIVAVFTDYTDHFFSP